MYTCDVCRREYAAKKSLTRHVKEKHVDNKSYPCAITTCNARFIRRSYLITHLRKVHHYDRKTAKTMAFDTKANSHHSPKRDSLEEISDSEDFFDRLATSPYQPQLEPVSEDENIMELIDSLDTYIGADTDVNNNNNNNIVIQDLLGENDAVYETADVNHNETDYNNIDLNVFLENPLHNGNYENVENHSETEYIEDVCDSAVNNDVNDVSDRLDDGLSNSAEVSDNVTACDEASSGDEYDVDSYVRDYVNDVNGSQDDDNVTRADSEDNDDVIGISSDGENETDEVLVTSINLTLCKTEKVRDGKVHSVKRTASIGYSENICQNDITDNLKKIIDYVQTEFKEYADYYHDTTDK